jgi:hypothetical protein
MRAAVLVVLSTLSLATICESLVNPIAANLMLPDRLLTTDWQEDSLAKCTDDQAVAITLDSLFMPQSSRTNATYILAVSLAPVQLAGAVVFAAAGLTVAVQSPGEQEGLGSRDVFL